MVAEKDRRVDGVYGAIYVPRSLYICREVAREVYSCFYNVLDDVLEVVEWRDLKKLTNYDAPTKTKYNIIMRLFR
jgi:hypothetical protein